MDKRQALEDDLTTTIADPVRRNAKLRALADMGSKELKRLHISDAGSIIKDEVTEFIEEAEDAADDVADAMRSPVPLVTGVFIGVPIGVVLSLLASLVF